MEGIFVGGAFFALIGAAAFYDLWKFVVPNFIPIALSLLFLAVAVLRQDDIELIGHVGAGILVFGIGALAYRFRVLGGGDVKLLAAVALWVGWDLLPLYLLAVALCGGVLALLLLGLRGLLHRIYRPASSRAVLPPVLRLGESVPYAMAIGAGAVFVGPQLPILAAAA